MDGDSLVAVLKDPEGAAATGSHAYHVYPKGKLGRAIRDRRYRMVEWWQPGADRASAEYELYDYESDPEELNNLATSSNFQDQRNRLSETLRQHFK